MSSILAPHNLAVAAVSAGAVILLADQIENRLASSVNQSPTSSLIKGVVVGALVLGAQVATDYLGL